MRLARKGPVLRVVQNDNVLSCNSNYCEYILKRELSRVCFPYGIL